MGRVTLDAKMKIKRSTVLGEVPTIGPSADHTDGTWSATNIYSGELFLNEADSRLWVGAGAEVKELSISDKTEVYTVLPGWDMSTDKSLTITHGLSSDEWLTIRNVTVMILDDSGANMNDFLAYGDDTSIRITATQIIISREDGIFFDTGTSHNDSAVTRGFYGYTYTKD